MTMAGLQELRFPEEKPLLRGQDATEMVSPPLAVLGQMAPPRGQEENRVSSLPSCLTDPLWGEPCTRNNQARGPQPSGLGLVLVRGLLGTRP